MRFTLNDVIDIINNALRGLFGFLCEIIYPGIAGLYDLFKELGTLFYVDDFVVIYNKISLIIGIFMVFRVTFWLIESLINPDSMSDKEKKPGKIIQKVLISVVLLATTPTIFEAASTIQNKIINSNIIENVLSMGVRNNGTTAGRYLASEMFINFYTPTVTEVNGEQVAVDTDCTDFYTGREGVIYSNLFTYGKMNELNNYCLTKKINDDKDKEFEIDFNGVFATAVGIFVFWMILMYCISLATRYVQLIYLQIIAPIPIMCYLAPGKDNMFSKWVKQCTITYLDLFIRLAIINFVMLLCNMLLSNTNGIMSEISTSSTNGWITIFLILGLLTFAKKAPDLIQELLPKSVTKASGDFGLSLKKRTESMLGGKAIYGVTKTAAKAATFGVAGAGITGAVGFLGGRGAGRLTGLAGGLGRGLVNGVKSGSAIKNLKTGLKQQTDMNNKKIDWANNGSTWSGRMKQRMSNILGYEGMAESMDNEITAKNDLIDEKREKIYAAKRKSSIFTEVSNTKSSIEDRAKKRLLEKDFSKYIDQNHQDYKEENAKKFAKFGYIQRNVIIAKEKLEAAQASGEGIAEAQLEYNNILSKSQEDYITAFLELSKEDQQKFDSTTQSKFSHLESMVESDNEGILKSKVKLDATGKSMEITNYDELDAFDIEVTNANNELIDGKEYIDADGTKKRSIGIAEVEREIQALEDEVKSIRTSEKYKDASADRNAVGGHTGRKS